MPQSAPKPFNVLDKAKSESYSEKDADTFNRVETRMARYAKAKMKVFMSQFQSAAWDMSFVELFQEKHSSNKLGKHLRIMNQPRPGAKWEAHHIVSGDHKEAIPSREALADDGIKILIDDPDNGCWMPKTKADARPTIYPNAIGHNRIHRQLYYDWIYRVIEPMQTDGQVRAFLNTVRMQLLQGNIKPEMKLQQEIDKAEYSAWLKRHKKL